MDKKGRPRPDGYKMEIEPKEAAVILRIFTSYAEGMSVTQIVKTFNEETVPGSIRSAKGWSPATISRILDNEKYAGRWIWNRTESRRDPKTGRRRRFDKPESEWVINEDEELRIVTKPLWNIVRDRRKEMHRTWPGGNGKRGFSKEQGSRQAHFPTHVLAGSMVCGSCGATIAQVSGKSGGYYGCLAATKGACDNKTLVRRTLAEKVIIGAIQDNFVDFIGEGRGSQALAKALVETERRVEQLADEVEALRRGRDKIFRPPPIEWIKDRLINIQQVLEQRTARSTKTLRSLLGPIRLELVTPTSVARSIARSRVSTP